MQHNYTDEFHRNTSECHDGYCYYSTANTPHNEGQVFFSKTTIILFQAAYIALLVVGILANILTFVAMVRRLPKKRPIHIYTSNLAICDLLILLFYIPTQMTYIKDQLSWYMGLEMCKVVNIILPIMLTCTIGTLLAITFDRLRGMLKPFKWRTDSVKKSIITLPVVWFLSIALNFPLFIYPKLGREGSEVFCSEGWPHHKDGEIFWVCMFVLVFCIPLVVLMISYVIMINLTGKKSIRVNQKHNKKMIRMGASLVIVFAVCTGFQHFFFFATSSFSKIKIPLKSLTLLYGISNFFVSLQAVVNPFIYGTMRDAFLTRKMRRRALYRASMSRGTLLSSRSSMRSNSSRSELAFLKRLRTSSSSSHSGAVNGKNRRFRRTLSLGSEEKGNPNLKHDLNMPLHGVRKDYADQRTGGPAGQDTLLSSSG